MSSLKNVLPAVLLSLLACYSSGQAKPAKDPDPVHLELFAEVAATTENGQPAALRITLKNVGNLAADLSIPAIGCSSKDGSLQVRMEWHSKDPEDHSGMGWGCASGVSDGPSLLDRASKEWIRLQPGEFLTVTENLRPQTKDMKPGTVDYWVEYTPPTLSKAERIELQSNGYLVPTESLKTESHTFAVD